LQYLSQNKVEKVVFEFVDSMGVKLWTMILGLDCPQLAGMNPARMGLGGFCGHCGQSFIDI
jgi:hypothetical protein